MSDTKLKKALQKIDSELAASTEKLEEELGAAADLGMDATVAEGERQGHLDALRASREELASQLFTGEAEDEDLAQLDLSIGRAERALAAAKAAKESASARQLDLQDSVEEVKKSAARKKYNLYAKARRGVAEDFEKHLSALVESAHTYEAIDREQRFEEDKLGRRTSAGVGGADLISMRLKCALVDYFAEARSFVSRIDFRQVSATLMDGDTRAATLEEDAAKNEQEIADNTTRATRLREVADRAQALARFTSRMNELFALKTGSNDPRERALFAPEVAPVLKREFPDLYPGPFNVFLGEHEKAKGVEEQLATMPRPTAVPRQAA